MTTSCPWPQMAGGGTLLCPCCAQELEEKHRRTERISAGQAVKLLVFLEELGWTAASLLEHASEALDFCQPGMTDFLRLLPADYDESRRMEF